MFCKITILRLHFGSNGMNMFVFGHLIYVIIYYEGSKLSTFGISCVLV